MTENIAPYVDHTLLKPEATTADVEATIAEAAALGAYSVCLSPSVLPVSIPDGLKLAVVVGFPSGKHHSQIKAAEAALAASEGADEIDMVIDVGAAIEGRYDAVESDIRAVREAAPAPVVLKVIIESAALSDEAIVAVSEAAERAGADFVKTSTGFHPSGGATVHAVELMKQTVGDRLEVKASGGIRTRADAEAMIAAGATRLGLSSTRAVVEGSVASGSY
ncbi:deoxyribose-phosphate aldolase [Microbacterium sp. SORGH_AS_0862]|uniref:deoxyribose-phosphate aldolase n=1 Tax=Microbacterium sp. SORGH_AS_0862 TaxID=3041789 RepID=UPI0027943485|nr:deoxyribose-phosphate aldolase [Microbacterium sp. SORGH_AS_0862]MDQ1206853.1 deoxyribose-phosphate aldolase [Microbacterium sp. SORGH_AS_0862]